VRRWVLVMVIAGLAVGTTLAVAHEGESHGSGGQEHGGATQLVTGEVVDLACYLGEGLMGPKHRECAQKCITSGLPVGIKSEDRIYLAVGREHGPANATLAPLAATQVTAEGVVTERNGVHLITVNKVTINE